MNLHIVNRSPCAGEVVHQALTAMQPEDRVLLIEDGVQGALSALVDTFEAIEGRLYALREDLEARGLVEYCDSAKVTLVDMDGFVTLTEEAEKILSWY